MQEKGGSFDPNKPPVDTPGIKSSEGYEIRKLKHVLLDEAQKVLYLVYALAVP